VTVSDFTPQQRRIVFLLVIAVVVVFAMLAGFVITSLRSPPPTLPIATLPSLSATSVTMPSPTPSLLPSPTAGEGIWSQVQAARIFDQIAHQVETTRELSPRAEVPLSFLDEDEMIEMLQALYTERYPATRLLPYTTLGLLPATPPTIQANPAAGIYVPEQEQLYVAADQMVNNPEAQTLLAHAYVHALQDQHFDLEAMQERAGTIDAKLAIQALIEGDATLLTALYGYEDVTEANWGDLTTQIVRAENPDYEEALGNHRAWAQVQRFPNWEGRLFVEAVFEAGGWEAINGAYTNPPRSTEQILHPARYQEQPDDPALVVVPSLEDALGGGWTLAVEDTLGELITGLYLGQTLTTDRAQQAADGWDGDTFVVWEEDERQLVVWRTIWDGLAEASDFEDALTAMIPQRYLPVRPFDPPWGLTGHWWETDTGALHVRRTGRYVLFVRAPDANTLANVAEVLP
jgi:hypothetical protein